MNTGRLLGYRLCRCDRGTHRHRHSVAHAIRSAMAGSGANLLRPSSTPQAAVENLANEIGRQAWEKAYSSSRQQERIHRTGVRARPDRILSQPSHLRDPGQL